MKCEQCNNEATNSGSGLCEKCENELMDEVKKQQEEDLQEVYADIIRSMY